MRFRRVGTALEQSTLIYLDTADWSYMEEGRAATETNELRALCEAGAAHVIVTRDHLLEAAGLRGGRVTRLAFMRAFPAAIFIPVSGTQLATLGARALALAALDAPMTPWQVECRPLSELTMQDLLAQVRQLSVLWFAEDFSARAESRSRRAPDQAGREQRDMGRRLQRLAREGKEAQVVAQFDRLDRDRRVPRVAHRLLAKALVRLFSWANAKGIVSSAAKADFLFDQCVTRTLPRDVASDPRLMSLVYTAWCDAELMGAFAPALACVATISRDTSDAADVQKIRSTEIDKRHAAFASIVDVFTCDKRIRPLVQRALRHAPSAPLVFGTNSLDGVVQAVTTRRDRAATVPG